MTIHSILNRSQSYGIKKAIAAVQKRLSQKGYSIFLDGERMPVAPEKITRKIQNRNETIDLANGTEFNIIKDAGLTEYEFDLLLPNQEYPFARYDNGYKSATTYLSLFETLKTSKKTFEFSGIRGTANGSSMLYQFCTTVTLEDYKIIESADNGDDLKVEINLKEYEDIKTLKYTINSAGVLTKTSD